jgi:uncharacterized protein YjbI with pentapeptide repeats
VKETLSEPPAKSKSLTPNSQQQMIDEVQLSLLKSDVSVWNDWREANPDARIELSYADLSGMDLTGANLSYANMTGVSLKGANLKFVNLTGALLNNANLSMIRADRAVIACAELERANLCGAWIRGADMRNSFLTFAEATNATFRNCNMEQCDFTGANFTGSSFWDANFNETWVDTRTNFSGADLNNVFGFATTNANDVGANGVITDERTILPWTVLDDRGYPVDFNPDPITE